MMYVMLLVGFVLLIKGADIFVEGSSSVARLLRIPGIIIGLTVVAFGTSAPEAAVSIAASVSGSNDIAVANVIGSNIFNLLMVIGVCAAIIPMTINKKILYGDFPFSIIISVVMFVIIFFDGELGRVDGLILLGLFVYFLYSTVKNALNNRTEAQEEEDRVSPLRSGIYIVIGLLAIVVGGETVVNNATKIAQTFGLSETLIGLTIVAMGTSLPELVTSIVAAKKGENGLALGNVIGSNIFNILLVLGSSAVISPMSVSILSIYDLVCLIVASIAVWIFAKGKLEVSRTEGITLVVLYFAYMIYIIVR